MQLHMDNTSQRNNAPITYHNQNSRFCSISHLKDIPIYPSIHA